MHWAAAATPIPLINIGTAFSAAANAAVGMTLSPPFSPYTNDLFFLHGAFIFEDVGELCRCQRSECSVACVGLLLKVSLWAACRCDRLPGRHQRHHEQDLCANRLWH